MQHTGSSSSSSGCSNVARRSFLRRSSSAIPTPAASAAAPSLSPPSPSPSSPTPLPSSLRYHPYAKPTAAASPSVVASSATATATEAAAQAHAQAQLLHQQQQPQPPQAHAGATTAAAPGPGPWRPRASSLMNRLYERELGASSAAPRARASGTAAHEQRKVYAHLLPVRSVFDVAAPPLFVKRFTPDGRLLVCFSQSLRSVFVYRFRGCSPAGSPSEFGSFFALRYEVPLIDHSRAIFCRDFCLFSNCGKYMILASCHQVDEDDEDHHAVDEAHNCSQPNAHSLRGLPLENITFHVVELASGRITHRSRFRRDFIQLVHHSGVYLYKDLFAVLSIQNQAVHVFQLRSDGSLHMVRVIGQGCYEDDGFVMHSGIAQPTPVLSPFDLDPMACCDPPAPTSTSTSTSTYPSSPSSPYVDAATDDSAASPPHAYDEPSLYAHHALGMSMKGPLPVLKHRILAYLFREAQKSASSHDEMQRFCQRFAQYESLVLVKMQLLDEIHLLLKYTSPQSIAVLSSTASHDTGALFIVYNTVTTEIVNVFENTCIEFAQLFKQFNSSFRACRRDDEHLDFSSTCSNNVHLRDFVDRQARSLQAKSGSKSYAAKRLLAALPFSPQIWNDSPYLDQSLFRYDESLISAVDKPRAFVDIPIRFSSREYPENSGFAIRQGHQSSGFMASARFKVASYIFHPIEPFIITTQQTLRHSYSIGFQYRGGEPAAPAASPTPRCAAVQLAALPAATMFEHVSPAPSPAPSPSPSPSPTAQQQQQEQQQQQQQSPLLPGATTAAAQSTAPWSPSPMPSTPLSLSGSSIAPPLLQLNLTDSLSPSSSSSSSSSSATSTTLFNTAAIALS